MVYYKSQYEWIGFHPLYNLTNQGFFHRSVFLFVIYTIPSIGMKYIYLNLGCKVHVNYTLTKCRKKSHLVNIICIFTYMNLWFIFFGKLVNIPFVPSTLWVYM